MKEFIISDNDAGQRLDRFVTKAVPLLPASLLQKYIRIKRVKVNNKGAKREYKLVVNDMVQMYINDEFFDKPTEENVYLKITDPSLDILYEDNNIILVNKPVGILCHSDEGFDHSSVIARLQAYLYQTGEWRPREENSFTPALCNRIDRNTSGIVVAAKNAEALRIINEKFKLLEIDKYYLTIVHGIPTPPETELKGFIFKDAVKNKVFVTENSQPGSKTAIMKYKTIASQNNLSLLECKLITGRTHQIRAQLAHAGYPILGDGKYGNGRLDKNFNETKQALCSYKILFNFKSDAGTLNYLNKQIYRLSSVSFVDKYFDFDERSFNNACY